VSLPVTRQQNKEKPKVVDGKNQQVRLYQLQPHLREKPFHQSQPQQQQQHQAHQKLIFFFFLFALLLCNLVPQNPWPHVGPDPTHTHTHSQTRHHPTTAASLSTAPTPAIPSNPRSDPIRIRFGPHFSSSVGAYRDQFAGFIFGSEFGEGEAGGESRVIAETWKVCATASQAGVCG
jgi:hypothetical protein